MTREEQVAALLTEAFTMGRDYQRTSDQRRTLKDLEEPAEEWKKWRAEMARKIVSAT